MSEELRTSTGEMGLRIPREIAVMTICGAMKFVVNEDMAFIQPTPEQIKNLRETFNIDVEILDVNKGGDL